MEYVLIALIFLSLILLLLIFFKKNSDPTEGFEDALRIQFQKEFLLNREELSKNLQENRNELTQSFER